MGGKIEITESEEARNRFLELMYLILYAMVSILMREQNDPSVSISDRILMVDELKRNIAISYNNIVLLEQEAEVNRKMFENNNEYKEAFDTIIRMNEILEDYRKASDDFCKKLIEESGGYDENNEIKRPEDKEGIVKMIESGEFENVKNSVKNIYDNIKDINKDDEDVKKILDELSSYGIVQKKEGIDDKQEETIFTGKILIDVLQYMYSKQLNITTYMRIICDKIMKGMDLSSPKFEDFRLIVIPKKDIIFAGENYEADVFLNVREYVKIEGEEPSVFVDDKPIKVNDGIAKIVYPTSSDMEFNEEGKAYVNLTIHYCQKNPFSEKEIDISRNVGFTIINKIDIDGKIETTKMFYKMCSNRFTVKNGNPELNGDLSYKVDGGRIVEIDKINSCEAELIIVPTEDKCTLKVCNGGKEVKSFDFVTEDVPMPMIEFSVDDEDVEDGGKINAKEAKSVGVTVFCDETFKNSRRENSDFNDSNFVIKEFFLEFRNEKGEVINSRVIKPEEDNSEDKKGSITYEFTDEDIKIMNSKKCNIVHIELSNVVREHIEKGKKVDVPAFQDGEMVYVDLKVLHE